ncbi:PTS transporter subunit EIIB [Streptococcus dentasini]
MNNSQLADDIIKNVGGKDNIKDVRYCTTRLRLRLKRVNKANADMLKQLDGVAMALYTNGQYQLVMSNVKEVYDSLVSTGIKGVGQVDTQDAWNN